MGYTTQFDGEFTLDKPLAPEHKAYLDALATTRRMKRNPAITATFPDPVREAAGLPLGDDAEFYVGSTASFGQDRTPDVVDYNDTPSDQPGLWLQWIPDEKGSVIEWDGNEKFSFYVEWLEYLIAKLLTPWGYKLSGEVGWSGEGSSDHGVIYVNGDKVEAVADTNPGPSWK